MRLTRVYARMADRTVADQYNGAAHKSTPCIKPLDNISGIWAGVCG